MGAPGYRSAVLHWGIVESTGAATNDVATFCGALGAALRRQGHDVSFAPMQNDQRVALAGALNDIDHLTRQEGATRRASQLLNHCDIVLLEHDSRRTGGTDGESILRVIGDVRVPIVTVLHAVFPSPREHQRAVINQIVGMSSCVVVTSVWSLDTLRSEYDLGATPVHVISCGVEPGSPLLLRDAHDAPLLLTCGLLGPGKGIEWMIDAMKHLRDISPTPRYVVSGSTHPKVMANEGELYRHSLESRVQDNGVGDLVFFDNTSQATQSLRTLIASATVVILPRDSSDHDGPEVLLEAIAAGRPVITTPFSHSVEMLSTGAGVIVEPRNARALSDTVRDVVCHPTRARDMSAEATRTAVGLRWENVASRYIEVARASVATQTPAVHA